MKDVKKMTDKELVDAYNKGKTLTIQQEQVTGTTINNAGKEYNHEVWESYLHRLEELEEEIKCRGNLWKTIN